MELQKERDLLAKRLHRMKAENVLNDFSGQERLPTQSFLMTCVRIEASSG